MLSTLQTNNVTKRYGGRKVVDGVSISVKAGEVVGLLGPNGAGKTTTFYMCVGLTAPDTGSVTFNDRDITAEPMYMRARHGIGYLPQEASVFRKLSVRDNVLAILETMDFPSKQVREARLTELLDELGLLGLQSNLASSLSGGERRRVEISRCLARNPQFILLDEPFAGIDPLAIKDIQEIVSTLKKKGIGVLITDHNVRETLGICDRSYILVDGKVLEEGTPQAISKSEKARRYYLGGDFEL
ncbi:MAG: LPS export ABC transporter ATP-binding protein [Proteobacteria bacterium]|mgnify:CR=1 FL=1|jgi:lipopolysaccharide export system ATP-binding protein|nr:LPS export ABC transporter ATP-binding protein [Pseudomonadota bacterium]